MSAEESFSSGSDEDIDDFISIKSIVDEIKGKKNEPKVERETQEPDRKEVVSTHQPPSDQKEIRTSRKERKRDNREKLEEEGLIPKYEPKPKVIKQPPTPQEISQQ